MAITDVAVYAHLSKADIEALGYELDAIRRDIEESRGRERDSQPLAHPMGVRGDLLWAFP